MNTKRLTSAAVAGALGLGLMSSMTTPASAAAKPGRTFIVKLSPHKRVVAPTHLKATGYQRIAIRVVRHQRPGTLRVQAIKCNGTPLGDWKYARPGHLVLLTQRPPKRGTCLALRWERSTAGQAWINLAF